MMKYIASVIVPVVVIYLLTGINETTVMYNFIISSNLHIAGTAIVAITTYISLSQNK